MSCDYYWMAYKLFYNPPGLPDNLRCVGCKYTTAAGLLAVSSVAGVKTYKIINPRPYLGMTLAFVSLFSAFAGASVIRLAWDDEAYNKQRIKEHAAEVKRKRREKSGEEKQ